MNERERKIIIVNFGAGLLLLFLLGFLLIGVQRTDEPAQNTNDIIKKTDEMPMVLADSTHTATEILQKSVLKLNSHDRVQFNPNSYFTRVAQEAIPRVVAILSVSKNKSGIFDFFKKDNHPDIPVRSMGSGTIISSDGYILTNNHVVKDANSISVKIDSRRPVSAEIIGTDPATDLALIRINSDHPLPYFDLNRADSIVIGEWVLAVGNPLNFNSTVTAGIVCAKNRQINIINESYRVESFIQTDAVINPGNSGGPLVNINGNLIGINTAIASRTGLYEGFGFAVPIHIIRRVVQDLKKFRRVKRGLLGVRIGGFQDVWDDSDLSRGVRVVSVQQGKAADKAGIREDDIIMALNGKPVHTANDLQVYVNNFHPGDSLSVLLIRKKRQHRVTVILEEMDLRQVATAEKPEPESEEYKVSPNRFKIKTRMPTEQERRKIDVEYGVVVERADEVSGIMANDVLLKINGHKIFSPGNFDNLVSLFDESETTLKIKILRNENGYQKILSMDLK